MSDRRYLYNGYDFAVLPARNKELFPHAIIYYVANELEIEEAHFGYSDQPFYLDTTLNLVTNTADATIYASIYDSTTKSWGEIYQFYDAAFALDPAKVIWANKDILDDAGTVVLPATPPVLIETRPAPLSLKMLLTGMLDGFMGIQSPICSARTITGYSYNGAPLPKISDAELVGHKFAVIYGGTDGKYHLCLFSARPNVLTDAELGGDGGFIESSWYLYYKIFANYSTEDESIILAEWIPYETDTIAATGTIDFDTPLKDPFVKDGILWASFNLMGEDGVQRMAASRIYPVTEVIGNG